MPIDLRARCCVRVSTAVVLALGLGAGCSQPSREPPSASAAPHVSPEDSNVGDTAGGAPAPAPDGPSAEASASASPAPSASAALPPPEPDPLETPKLLGADGKPLGQTKDRPLVDSPAFQRRLELLWQAIREDDPEIAMPIFFPLVAYEQVKAIEKPGDDWRRRLVKAFERNVHEYHAKLGKDAASTKLLGIDVDEGRVKWMKPHSEGNALGYFRVTRSKLRYEAADGKERKLDVTSLISWRGEWFVVHLHGFK